MSTRRITKKFVDGMVEKYSTPTLLTFEDVLTGNYLALARLMPRVKIFYAVKANSDLPVVETILRLGGNLDIASMGELEMCREIGVQPSRILYTQPIKKEEEIAAARTYGIELLVCENEEEIRKVGRVYPGCGILLRIRVKNPFCVVDLSQKFGCEPEVFPELADLVLASGLKLEGVCFHVGSQTISPSPYIETLKLVKSLINDLALRGIDVDIVDIGGGFPLAYLDPIISIDSFCEPVVNTVDHLFGAHEIFAEPGRFIVGNASILLVRVIGKSIRDGVVWYYIDDGLYGTFSGKVYDHADYPIRTFRTAPKRGCVIAGPTCDSFDIAFKDRYLPELEVGDVVVIECIGAYSTASSSRFNGMPGARKVFLKKES